MIDFNLRWYWGIFVQAWWLFRKYQNVHGDTEWENLVKEAMTLRERYPGEFSQKIIIAVLEELDKRSKYEE